jgi:hypothetical protein
VIDSPYILAGIVVVIVAIVVGIVAAILRSRADNSFSFPSSKSAPAYEPPTSAASQADLSKLDALGGSPAPAPAPADAAAPEANEEPEEPPAHEPPPPPDVVDAPERYEDEPLPGLWAHLVATEEGPLDVQDRLDMVTRLEMVGEKWCVDALHSATQEEQDSQVNAAVRAALVRLGA